MKKFLTQEDLDDILVRIAIANSYNVRLDDLTDEMVKHATVNYFAQISDILSKKIPDLIITYQSGDVLETHFSSKYQQLFNDLVAAFEKQNNIQFTTNTGKTLKHIYYGSNKADIARQNLKTYKKVDTDNFYKLLLQDTIISGDFIISENTKKSIELLIDGLNSIVKYFVNKCDWHQSTVAVFFEMEECKIRELDYQIINNLIKTVYELYKIDLSYQSGEIKIVGFEMESIIVDNVLTSSPNKQKLIANIYKYLWR